MYIDCDNDSLTMFCCVSCNMMKQKTSNIPPVTSSTNIANAMDIFSSALSEVVKLNITLMGFMDVSPFAGWKLGVML